MWDFIRVVVILLKLNLYILLLISIIEDKNMVRYDCRECSFKTPDKVIFVKHQEQTSHEKYRITVGENDKMIISPSEIDKNCQIAYNMF
jgi:hypothetical protein